VYEEWKDDFSKKSRTRVYKSKIIIDRSKLHSAILPHDLPLHTLNPQTSPPVPKKPACIAYTCVPCIGTPKEKLSLSPNKPDADMTLALRGSRDEGDALIAEQSREETPDFKVLEMTRRKKENISSANTLGSPKHDLEYTP
jgi:hypothetical protein